MTDKALTAEGEIRRLDGPEILFSHRELADRASGVVKLHPGFADALSDLRMSFGQSMIVNSCCRSKKRNGEIGGHERSLHVYDEPFHEGQTGTLAIDIKIKSPDYARTLALRALLAGWSVGVARGFLHLDRRDLIGLAPRIFGYGR